MTRPAMMGGCWSRWRWPAIHEFSVLQGAYITLDELDAFMYKLEGGRFDTEANLRAAPTGTGVRFAVVDTSPGLTPEQAAHVFERFYRADDARQRDHGGSGLGLAIAQELVRLHGGRIWIESAPGAGSTVFVEIPAGGARAGQQMGL